MCAGRIKIVSDRKPHIDLINSGGRGREEGSRGGRKKRLGDVPEKNYSLTLGTVENTRGGGSLPAPQVEVRYNVN